MPDQTESVDEFRLRVRAWLADNMPRLAPDAPPPDRAEDDETWVRDKELQRKLWDGGFAGICFPKEYGGLGLTIEHQHAFTEESLPYEMPILLNLPSTSICLHSRASVAPTSASILHSATTTKQDNWPSSRHSPDDRSPTLERARISRAFRNH